MDDTNKYLGNQILSAADMLEGCKNRMCITKEEDELSTRFCSLLLYAADLYRLNRKRIRIQDFDLDD